MATACSAPVAVALPLELFHQFGVGAAAGPGDAGGDGPEAEGFPCQGVAVRSFGERPVQRGDRRVLAGVLARLDGQLAGDLRHGDALLAQGGGSATKWPYRPAWSSDKYSCGTDRHARAA